MDEKTLMAQQADRCEQAGCNDEQTKRHVQQARDEWPQHPPQDFCAWYGKHQWYRNGIQSRIAWNCAIIRGEYLDAKQVGLV